MVGAVVGDAVIDTIEMNTSREGRTVTLTVVLATEDGAVNFKRELEDGLIQGHLHIVFNDPVADVVRH